MFNFRIYIKFCIHEEKKTSKFRETRLYICTTNTNNQDFYVFKGISL